MSSVIYAWALDGVPTLFVSDEALDDTYALANGFVDSKVGLRKPTSLPARVDLRALMPEQTPTTIKVDDLDGSLAALFGVALATGDDLVTTIEPATDPAPASLWGKHVGTEKIGPAGERREHGAFVGFAVGLKHLGGNEAFANGGSASKVSDTPLTWVGRWCAVYRVELVDGTWQTLAEAKRVWWGTMRGQGTYAKGVWAFGVLGPDSLIGGNLGTGNYENPLRALPVSTFTDADDAGPTVMRASLDIVDLKDDTDVFHTYLLVGDPDGTSNMGTVTGYDDVAAAINTFLDQVISSTDQGTAYDNNADGNDIRLSTLEVSDGITIRWFRGDTGASGDPFIGSGDKSSYTARLRLILHEDVWKKIGYDVIQQTPARDAVEHEEQYGRFEAVIYPEGYYQGLFYPANPKAMKASDDQDFGGVALQDYSSGGFDRVWPPLYRGGTFTFTGQPRQEVQLDTAEEVLLAGSLARPLLEDPTDNTSPYTLGGGVGEVNRAGVLVLEGPYRRRGDQDQNSPADGYAFDNSRERKEGATVQAIRVCWRATPGGLITTDDDGKPRLVVQEWLEPRAVGMDYQALDGTWGGHRNPPEGATAITARPLIMWDVADGGDKTTTVIQRIMATTGTGVGWFTDGTFVTPAYGLGAAAAVLEAGANDLGGDTPSDAEESSLGLGIPASLIADPAVWASVGSIPGPHLSRCKAVAGVAADARVLVARLLGPMGVCLGYSDGKYTPFDPWSFPTPADAVATITTEAYAGSPTADPMAVMPTQSLRKWAPIDKLELRGRIEPIGGDYFRRIQLSASDPGARSRAQQIVHNVNGDHLVHPLLNIQGGSWQHDVEPRWRPGFWFWGANNSVVPIPVHASFGLDIWPGDGVLVTDPGLLDTLGLYGVSLASGRVIGRVYNAATEVIKLDVMIAAETDFRMWGPSAVVTEYDEADPFRLVCDDDGLGDRGGNSVDVEGFAEPSYSSEGGLADVEVFSFGELGVWTGGIFGQVSTVDTTPGSSSITLVGALTGAAWLSDEHHVVVLREFGSQTAAWVKRFFGPICAEDGTHTGGQPGVRWRGL